MIGILVHPPLHGYRTALRGSWYQTIQTALGESVMDDRIVVEPGVFRENVHFQGRNVGLQSTNPGDPMVVGRTIIQGHTSGAVVAFDGTEDEEYCIVMGLTLRHGEVEGYYPNAWGILRRNTEPAHEGPPPRQRHYGQCR